VENGVDDEVEAFPVAKVLDVFERSSREIVEDPYLVAFIEQQLGKVGSDEPGPARD
jgi:hypothetical protein